MRPQGLIRVLFTIPAFLFFPFNFSSRRQFYQSDRPAGLSPRRNQPRVFRRALLSQPESNSSEGPGGGRKKLGYRQRVELDGFVGPIAVRGGVDSARTHAYTRVRAGPDLGPGLCRLALSLFGSGLTRARALVGARKTARAYALYARY